VRASSSLLASEQLKSLASNVHSQKLMRIAIPHWQGRVSPVFDVALNFLLIDIESGRELRRQEKQLREMNMIPRVSGFLTFGARILICGAISAPIEARLVESGVQVIGFACGTVEDVLAAYLSGKPIGPAFSMPGCERWRRPREGGCGAGRGQGGRMFKGQGAGRGETGGVCGAGPDCFCVCPQCGEKTPHTAGKPCAQVLCPNCGSPMARF